MASPIASFLLIVVRVHSMKEQVDRLKLDNKGIARLYS